MAVAFGQPAGDPVAGFAVTLFIAHVGYEVTAELVHHLMDGIDPEILERATRAAESVPGVLEATLAGRWMGRTLRLEVAARLDPTSSIGDAALVGDAVEAAVLHAVDEARVVRFIPVAA